MSKNNARMIDINSYIQAGMDPKTGLPLRMGSCDGVSKEDFKKIFRIIDEQDAVNRYTWTNLPCDLTSQELERMLYYKGQLCFFYFEAMDKFFFMPYALDGSIDFYGRFNSVHPVPFTDGTDSDKNRVKNQSAILSMLRLECKYAPIVYEDQVTYDLLTNSCVLLHDYTKQLSQTIISRQIINDPLLDVMSDIIPFLKTSLMNSTGIKGMRVNDADQKDEVNTAAKSVYAAALTGKPWVPILGNIEFQELTGDSSLKATEYMLSLQSLDNLRLSTLGLENGGLFEKKAHELQEEAAMNNISASSVLQDGLAIRQNFCNIVNSIWDLGIWCEITENEIGDANMDGMYDDGNESGVDTQTEESDSNAD